MRTYNAVSFITAVKATVPLGSLTVRAVLGEERTTVRLTPHVAGDPLAGSAIANAQITERDGTLHLAVPHRAAAAHARGGGDVYNTVTGNVTGVVISARDINVVGGDIVSSAVAAQQNPTAELIDAELVVPAGTRADLASTDGTITTDGPLDVVTAHTVNGPVDIDAAATLFVITNSGDIQVGLVTSSAVLSSINGHITIVRTETPNISVYTVNGSVTVTQAPGIVVPAVAVGSANGHVQVL